MLKFLVFCCAILSVTKALNVQERCIIEFLKQRNLLNETTFPNYFARARSNDCDQIVKKVVKKVYEANFDFVDEGASVDNKTYRECLKNEFDRHKMDEKFLKIKAFENEPQQIELEKIRDDFLLNIKLICAESLVKVSSQRFKDFVSDEGGPSLKVMKHPALVKIKENLGCMNRYAMEKEILDPAVYNLDLKLINQTDDDCKYVLYEVISLVMDEWHIRRFSEDDAIQRCFIGILLDTQAVDLFIKNALLSQLQLSQEQKDFERENFLKNSAIVHEMSYNCMLNDFVKI
jgi:hypothetical protein